jgi:hypothetical protein
MSNSGGQRLIKKELDAHLPFSRHPLSLATMDISKKIEISGIDTV